MPRPMPVNDGNRGINLFGSDSLIFNAMPSCFGLRINNLLLLNASADFFCSEGCGFPHPVSLKMLMGGDDDGRLRLVKRMTPSDGRPCLLATEEAAAQGRPLDGRDPSLGINRKPAGAGFALCFIMKNPP